MSTKSVILVCFFVGATVALVFPEHNCSEYFTYGIVGDGSFIGVFTANEAGIRVLNFTAKFAWREPRNQISNIHGYPNENEAIININRGLRGQAFVRFFNSTDSLPTLTEFYLNDELLCNSTIKNFWKPHYEGKLTRVLFTQQNIRKVQNTRPKMHPIFPQIKPKI